ATSGSVEFLFEHKCHFTVKGKEGVDIEELELELIDSGAEEVVEDDGQISIFGTFNAFGPIQKYLEDNGFEIDTAVSERIPNDTKTLTDEQQEEIDKLLERLDDDDDVIKVFHNIA
ncbi:MAG TPA: YebC/PmpR family DNA-binding transcriptional regulator, partial [Bacteroidales bacterium]|nr:YebC/PmpR family DNA-binding transcriptional regulator [Bacteroidales bacterium]